MNKLQVSVTILLFLLSSFYRSHTDNAVGHKIYCPEDMYGQEYLKFYNMTAFLTTWTTTSPNESITIPTTGGGYLYDVAWGDGTTSVNRTGNASHVYSSPGDYQISITGSFPRIYFNFSGDRLKIISIDQWGVQPWISMESAFYGCQNLEELSSDSPNLSNCSSMSETFRLCGSLNQDLNDWNVTNITEMSKCFFACNSTPTINLWDVSNVTNMSEMFKNSGFNGDLGNWDVSSVANMYEMFRMGSFNQDISNWDVGNVTNMEGLFNTNLNFNQDISSWDVSNVTNMEGIFENAINFNQDISSWDVSNVTNMKQMFYFANNFNQNISSWDVSNVTNMRLMFSSANNFNQNISSWDVSSVTDMEFMFYNTSFNHNLSNWDISNGPYMANMLQNSGLSTYNYDQTLIGWAQQSPSSTILGVGNTQYCAGADARDMLINTYGWNITDGGQATTISIDNTFTNSNGNNLWEDAGNWSLLTRPTAIHNVIIPSGMTCIVEDWFLPTTFEDGLCYTIEVEDGAVFEVMDGATFRTAVPCNY